VGRREESEKWRLLEKRTYDEYPARIISPIPDRALCLEFARDTVTAMRQVFQKGSIVQVTA
jgi:hypothetical protein